VILAWGSVVGSALQFFVQLPAVLSVAPGVWTMATAASDHVRAVARGFVPVFVSRGVLQLSAYVDAVLASLLPTGAVTGLANAQGLYLLPVSLFGLSVAAAELPAMSGDAVADAHGFEKLRARLNRGLRQIAFFVVPSAVAFLTLGDVIAAALYQTGRFRYEDALYVWGILAGAAVGLLPSSLGRLYSSTFYALKDTKTPLAYALVHVVLAGVLGYFLAFFVPGWLGAPAIWGAAGLTLAAGLAGWAELLLLRRALNARIGDTGLAGGYMMVLWLGAAAGAASAWAVKWPLPPLHPALTALVVLGTYGGVFGGVMLALQVPEARAVVQRLQSRIEN
jgi:putative peptidoglycan lipid II flippase